MVAVAGRYPRVISRLLSLALAVAILGSAWLSLVTPPNFGLSLRLLPHCQAVVTWVAPNGPAWSVGMQPSVRAVTLRQSSPSSLTITGSEGLVHLTVAAQTPLQLLLAGLGLLLVVLGTIVAGRSVDLRAGLSFWFLTLCGGGALGFVPAGFHSVPWALAGEFVSLRLFGPALLEFTYHFPGQPTECLRPSPWRLLRWVPTLVILLLYPLGWWRPIPAFTVLQPVSDVVLLGYGVSACLRVIAVVRRPVSPHQRAQLQFLTLGMAVGLLPFLMLTALPLVLIGSWWVPGTVSILPFAVLLPLNMSLAIMRTEFLGIVGIVRRGTLQALVRVLLFLTIALTTAELAIAGTRRWGWAPAPGIVLASIGTATISLLLAPWLTRKLERIFVPDLYDPSEALVQLSAAFVGSDPDAIGSLVVSGIGAKLDLDFVLLMTPTAQFVWRHDRAPWSAALLQEMISLVPVHDGRWRDESRCLAAGAMQLPTLVAISLQQEDAGETMLCCGPKHSGEAYTPQDQTLLQALGHQLRILFRQQIVEARLSDQSALLRTLREDDGSLTREERTALTLAAQGYTNKEIGLHMAMHPRTVEKHLTAIYHKWGVTKRSEALQVARRTGLVSSQARSGTDNDAAKAGTQEE